MDRKKLMSRIMPIVVAGSVLLSTGGFVYAQTTAKTANNKSMSQMKNKDSQKNIKSKLDALVKSSVITQDQETKVLDFMKQKDTERKAEMDKVKNMSEADRKAYFENNKKDKVNLADELVKASIVSQDQANAIVNAIKPAQGDKQHKENGNKMKSVLDNLVKSSTITQDQETKVLDFMKQKDTERKAEMDKVKNMSEADRKAYFESNKKEKVNLADELVKAGIVSQDQANSIINAMKPAQGDKQHKENGNKMKSALDNLVKSSTITQDQENKILDYIKQKDAERKAEMDKVKNMSEADRKAYFENNKKEKTDLLADLVKSGVITQDQANSIKQSMPTPKDGHMKKDINKN